MLNKIYNGNMPYDVGAKDNSVDYRGVDWTGK
jgi:hypothetical protein